MYIKKSTPDASDATKRTGVAGLTDGKFMP